VTRLNTTSVSGAGLLMTLGLLLGQILGLALPINTIGIFTILGGLIFGTIGYFITRNSANSIERFFTSLSVLLAFIVGSLLSGTTLGPILFINLTFFQAKLLLSFSILLIGASFALGALVLIKFTKKINNNFAKKPWSVMLWSSTLIFMILGGAFGITFGPIGLAIGLFGGLIFGSTIGIINNLVNNNSFAAKILSNIYAISGLISGIMTGIVFNTIFLSFAQPFNASIFGFIFMLAAAYYGNKIGNQIEKQVENHITDKDLILDKIPNVIDFDLNNPKFRTALFQGVFLVPTLFASFLLSGLLGISYGADILTSQALGTFIASIAYPFSITSYNLLKDLSNVGFKKFSSISIFKPKQPTNVIVPPTSWIAHTLSPASIITCNTRQNSLPSTNQANPSVKDTKKNSPSP